MLRISLFILTFWHFTLVAQEDTVLKIHFLYGSKPGRGHKKTEYKAFGGLHGGHVTFEIDNIEYGFGPYGKFHVFGRRKKHHSSWDSSSTGGQQPYTAEDKVTTIFIPVTREEKQKILAHTRAYVQKTPYDYAFFGMRCAAASHDALGYSGIVKKRKRMGYAIYSFYPKKLRRRLFKLALRNNWKIETHNGKQTRKWEKDGWKMRQRLKKCVP